MIGQNGNGNRLFPIFHRFIDRAYGTTVQVLNRLHLQGNIPFMAGLITGFDMQINKIVRLQCIKGRRHLILVIGVVKSGCTFHRQATQTGIGSDAVNQIYGGNDSTSLHLRELIRELFHLRTIAGAPWPDAVGRVFARGCALLVDGMFLQQSLRTHNQVVY